MKKALPLIFVLLVSACNKPVENMNYAEIHTLANEIDTRCQAQAGPKGSPAYQTCTQIEVNHEVQTRRQNAAAARAFAEGMAEGMTAASASYAAASQRPIYSPPRPVYCQTQQFGQQGTISCQ